MDDKEVMPYGSIGKKVVVGLDSLRVLFVYFVSGIHSLVLGIDRKIDVFDGTDCSVFR